MKAAKLFPIDLKEDNKRPLFQDAYVHVYGYVANAGTYNTNNAKIHVVLHQAGGVIAKDTYLELGTIYGESAKIVDAKVFYSARTTL